MPCSNILGLVINGLSHAGCDETIGRTPWQKRDSTQYLDSFIERKIFEHMCRPILSHPFHSYRSPHKKTQPHPLRPNPRTLPPPLRRPQPLLHPLPHSRTRLPLQRPPSPTRTRPPQHNHLPRRQTRRLLRLVRHPHHLRPTRPRPRANSHMARRWRHCPKALPRHIRQRAELQLLGRLAGRDVHR